MSAIARLSPGTLVAERFRIEAEAGAGGMGVVYRAHDLRSDQPVALKILAELGPVEAARFAREGTLLAQLLHPGIVRFVDQGRTSEHPGAAPWIAMEWLEGETLSARLRRGPLAPALAARVVRDVAAALSVAHRAGIVHRDLKPANVFLVGGDRGSVKLLDFGIARPTGRGAATLTTTGTVLGTPYTMAPEQARGGRTLDARVDVYALGCVLYECLTGARPFDHESVAAVLAAVLLEEAVPPRERVPSIPESLDALVIQMMSKRADARPESGEAVRIALDALLEDESALRPTLAPAPRALTGREQRVVCVVLVLGDAALHAGSTLAAGSGEDREGRVREVVAPRGGDVVALADGSLVVTVDGAGTASDQAASAARAALALRAALPDAPMAVAAGRVLLTGRVPVGELVQRGSELLTQRVLASPPGRMLPIRLDEAASGLLDARFVIRSEAGVSYLEGLARDPETPGALTAVAAPLFGRERELAQLEGLFEEAVGEPIARIAQVTGAPGSGKTRFAAALRERLAPRCARVIAVHCEPLGASAPLALAAELVREAAGIRDGEPLAERRAKITALAHGRTAAMLGELSRTPFDEAADPVLAGARRDPIQRGDLERRAFEDWLAAELARGPVLLLVDDAQHADRASLALLERASRLSSERPLTIVLLGRPELEPVASEVFASAEPMRLSLARLVPRAARALVEHALGTAASDEAVRRVVERGDGNPLYLEELARAVREGEAALPTSVLAMVESRLAVLDPEARRVARAASIFGMRAPLAGVQRLVGERAVEGPLLALSTRDFVTEERGAREGSTFVCWRHPLVREAAYATLTDDDRALGHRLAGEWLAENAEVEPSVLAQHFERGGAAEVAARAWAGAGELALAASDLGATLEHVARGLALAHEGALRATLLATRAEAARWRAEYAAALADAEEALALAAPGTATWLSAASTFVSAGTRLARRADVSALGDRIEAIETELATRPVQVAVLCRVAAQDLGARDEAAFLHRMARAEALAASLPRPDPIARAWIRTLWSSRAYDAGEIDAFVDGTTEAVRDYEAGGDARDACNQRVRLGHGWLRLGEPARARDELLLAAEAARRMGLRLVEGYALQNLGHAQASLGASADGRETLARAIEIARSLDDGMLEAGARVYLAELALLEGEAARALHEAERAASASDGTLRSVARALVARAQTATGRLAEALALATELRAATPEDDAEADPHVALALAEARLASGLDPDRTTAADALGRVEARGARIASAARRTPFFERVPAHAALRRLALAR
ncbi:MAG: protein kinase [Sandaracinus sp.]